MQKTTIYAILACLLIGGLGACRKYPEASTVPNAAYIRVFNDITTSVNFLNSAQATPFLTFIMDPKPDASGAPDTGLVVGDFLGTRQMFSLSYPINEGNSLGTVSEQIGSNSTTQVQLYENYDYPGNLHVLTAPAINGFDLSAWAQVPSGKHRFIFVLRPQTQTNFSQLSSTIRNTILIDTTIDLQAGEVYTLEALSTDLDQNKYGMYVRQEQFIHQSFAPDQLYVGFVNLSGVRPLAAQYDYFSDFSDTTAIYYSYMVYQNVPGQQPNSNSVYNPLPGYNKNYYTTLYQRMGTQISYLALPLLDSSYFFYADTLGQYATNINNVFGGTNGTFPYVQFTLYAQDSAAFTYFYKPFVLSCAADPVTFNNYLPGVGYTLNYCPNLDLITSIGGSYHIYPTLNIMEMVYDRVYMMQVQNGFNQIP